MFHGSCSQTVLSTLDSFNLGDLSLRRSVIDSAFFWDVTQRLWVVS